ncbi:hypothetical protein GY45DRAFT_208863 [Cubamyces sp. BRFM 1775]|nr:hypothetical protein GY45DRAFT_208863 [Cubamyces sp. BRFM 1775]
MAVSAISQNLHACFAFGRTLIRPPQTPVYLASAMGSWVWDQMIKRQATLSALPTFSSVSDRSRDAVPTPAPTGTTTSTPMTETPITVVAQEVTSSSDMSTSDVRTTAAIASVVTVLSFAVFSLVLYVLYRAHRRRQLEASRARIECWDREAEARASPESFLDKVLPSHLSGDHPMGGLYDDSVIHISPNGPFSAPYHARSPSTSIPPAVQPAGCETVGENIRASTTSSSLSQLEARHAELEESIAALKVFGNPRASATV